MTNKDIYKMIDRLGMLDGDDDSPCEVECDSYDMREFTFLTGTKDIIYTMNFVDMLATYNDIATIKKLLVAILTEGAKDVKE